jgi:hypothetical protein
MKTPRLTFLALLLALAPAARAVDLPKWTPLDEGSVMWPNVSFKVGSESRSLKCRYNECKAKGKDINLYIVTEVPGPKVPVKVPSVRIVERSKYSPLRLGGGDTYQETVYIDAFRKTYKSELSRFKLDNSGAEPVVVQGTQKFPAHNDINDRAFRSYDQMWVLAPAKLADDEVKPAAVPPVVRPPSKVPPAGAPRHLWCNPLDGTTQRRSDQPEGWTRMHKGDVCKKAAAGTAPAVVAGKLPFEDSELRWLTKAQQGELETKFKAVPAGAPHAAAVKAVVDEYRALVSAQIRPEAAAAYASAYGAPAAEAPAKINAAIGSVKMWGGDVAAPVDWSGPNLEIQLSPAELAALAAKPDDLNEYKTQHRLYNGGKGAAFDAAAYDPVWLHLKTVAARAAAGGTASVVTAPAGDAAALLPLLNEAQLKLLTPKERADYEAILKSAKDKDPKGYLSDRSLQDQLKSLTAKAQARQGSAYPDGGLTEKTFPTAPDWQKDKFCGPEAQGMQVASATGANGPQIDNSKDALPALKRSAAATTPPAGSTTGKGNKEPWAVKACKGYPFFKEPVVANGPSDTNSSINQDIAAKGTGPDVTAKEKAPSKWITQDLIVSGAKGALTGLLIGSLFGPVGLILGPVIGAAIFYGVTKLTS